MKLPTNRLVRRLALLGGALATTVTPAIAETFALEDGDNLQTAINTAANNEEADVIQLAAGTYTVAAGTSLTIAEADLTIEGIEAGVTISAQGSGSSPGIDVQAGGVILRNFDFAPPVLPGGIAGSGISSTSGITGLTIDDVRTRSSDSAGDSSLVFLEDVSGAVLTNLLLEDSTEGAGIELVGTSVAAFTNNTTSGNASGSVLVRPSGSTGSSLNVDLAANQLGEDRAIVVEDTTAGVSAVSASGDLVFKISNLPENLTVFTSKIEATATGIALELNTEAGNNASAVFDQTADEFVVAIAALSIQAAIDTADESGQTVRIAANSFSIPATIMVDKANIELIGDPNVNPTINAPFAGVSILTISADDVTLENLDFATAGATGLKVEAAGTTLMDIDVQGSADYGFEFTGATGVTLESSSTSGNTLGGLRASASSSLNAFTIVQSLATGMENQIAEDRAVVIEDADSVATPANSSELFLVENSARSIYTYNEPTALAIAVAEDATAATVTDLTAATEKLVVSVDLSLSAAIAAADSGATICLRDGSHTETPQIIIDGNRALTITGDSEIGTVLSPTVIDDPCGFFLVEDGATLNLGALTIDGVAIGFCEAVRAEGTAIIADVTFANVGGTAVAYFGVEAGGTIVNSTISGAGSAVTVDDATVALTGNTITGNETGIAVLTDDGTGSVIITNNDLSENTTFGVSSAGLQVDAQRNFWGTTDGPAGEGPGTGSAITANVDADPFYADAALATIRAASVTVNGVAQDNDLTFATVAEGLAAVIPDGIVNVEPVAAGYTEDVTIPETITLTGAGGMARPCISGTLTVGGDDVTISSLKITNPTGNSGVLSEDHNGLTLFNNNFIEIGSDIDTAPAGPVVAVALNTGGSAMLSGNTFEQIGSESLESGAEASAVAVNGAVATGLTGNGFLLDTIIAPADGTATGIRFDGTYTATDATIRNNFFEANSETGTTGATASDSAEVVDVSENYWDAPGGPEGTPTIPTEVNGTAVGENVSYVSYFANLDPEGGQPVDLRSFEIGVDDDFDEEVTPRFGLDTFASIDEAVQHLIPASEVFESTITVAAGSYLEDLVLVDRAATIEGPFAGTPAVIGNNDVGSVPSLAINPARSNAADEATVDGLLRIEADGVTISGLSITDEDGFAGVYAIGSQGVTVTNTIVDGVGTMTTASAQGIYVKPSGTDPVSGYEFSGNYINNIGSTASNVSTKGILFGDSNGRNAISGVVITGNLITNITASNQPFADGGRGAYGILFNHGASGSFDGSIVAPVIEGNTMSGMSGLWDRGIGFETDTPNAVASNNVIADTNTDGGVVPGTAIFFEDNNAPDTVVLTANVFRESNAIGVALAQALVDAGATADASNNYWDTIDGPAPGFGGGGLGSGPAVGPGVSFAPFFRDVERTQLSDLTNGDITVNEGETFEPNNGVLTIASGDTVTVNRGTLIADEIGLSEGGTLNVIDGDLVFGGSTLSGSFTFFNSLGSISVNGDLDIQPSAEGLILITEVHVAPGATITVMGGGALVIDGSVLDLAEGAAAGSTFTLDVQEDAEFTLARTVVEDAVVLIGAADSELYDNRFERSAVTAASTAAGATVFHNIVDDLAFLTDNSGGSVDAAVDGWANVTSAGDTENNAPLDVILPEALTGAADQDARTTDADGTIFIQPGDEVQAALSVDSLEATVDAYEVLLGFNQDYIDVIPVDDGDAATPDPVVLPQGDWQINLEDTEASGNPAVIGTIDSAIGLGFTSTPSDEDQLIGLVTLQAQDQEGETLFFHRVQLDDTSFIPNARLTSPDVGGAAPEFLRPFTSNSASVIVDDTDPVVASDSGTAVQMHDAVTGTVDVFAPDTFVLRNGNTVTLSFTATDGGLAGLDATDATRDVRLTADNGTTVLDNGDYTVTAVESSGTVTYTVVLTVPLDATTGTYNVAATVSDRSGNISPSASLGQFTVADEIAIMLALQRFVGSERVVTFVATDADGTPLDTWTRTLSFSSGVAMVSLENVPAGTAGLSAKTDWNLRRKLGVTFSGEGLGTANFTGTGVEGNELLGGDISRGDNIVNTLDFSVFRTFNGVNETTNPDAAAADITGDGIVNINDFIPLRANFFTRGDDE